MRFILLTAGVTLVVFLGLMIDAQPRTPDDRPAPPPGPSVICALGRIEGATPEIQLRPQVAGRIVALVVEEGQFVKKDQVLLRLDDERYRQEERTRRGRLGRRRPGLRRSCCHRPSAEATRLSQCHEEAHYSTH